MATIARVEYVQSPTHAAAGETFDINIALWNISTTAIPIMPHISSPQWGEVSYPIPSFTIEPNQGFTWAKGPFVMPNSQVVFTVQAKYRDWYDGLYKVGDSQTFVITLDSAPTSDGSITDKKVVVDLYEHSLPATSVTLNSPCHIKFTCRNDSGSTKTLVLTWGITGPSGDPVQEGSLDVNLMASLSYTFNGQDFQASQVGAYVIYATLEIEGQVVDSINTALLTVEELPDPDPPPEGYAGEIQSLSVLIAKGGLFGSVTFDEYQIPYANAKVGNEFRLKMPSKNTSAEAEKLGMHYVITKPDNTVIDITEYEIWPHTVEGDIMDFIEPQFSVIIIDQEGDWSVYVELLADGCSTPLDSMDSGLFTGVGSPDAPAGGYAGEILSLSVLIATGGLFGALTFDQYDIPYIGAKVNNEFRLRMNSKNTSTDNERLGMRYVITKPDTTIIDITQYEGLGSTGEGQEHEFIEPGFNVIKIDQIGDWSVYVELLADGCSTPLDSIDIGLFIGVEETQSTNIIELMVMVVVVMIMMQVMTPMMDLGESFGREPEKYAKKTSDIVVGGVTKGIKKVKEYFYE